MEKAEVVKNEIAQLLTNYFGDSVTSSFQSFYDQETLPIFTNAAYKLLLSHVGEQKAHDELNHILLKNSVQITYE